MLVNICMITYNHVDYITESIESILKQVTDFSIQFIIGEDKSTDGTREICIEYAEKFPNKIKLITTAENVGMANNFLRTYQACTGKYIAFCEGDDYWTDPYKLQKQVDFLEANASYSACFHNVVMKLQREGEQREWILHESLSKDTFDTEDVLAPWFIPSLSFVFVNYPDFKLPDWFFNCQYGDLPFMLLLSLRGNFKYLNEVMGVYRLHDTGLSAVHKSYDKIIVMVYIYASFDIYTKYKYHAAIRRAAIYEIDRHIPAKEILNVQKPDENIAGLKRYYKKMKQMIRKK
jgi:glycosyltransferase involved in cell wall biosynthesis